LTHWLPELYVIRQERVGAERMVSGIDPDCSHRGSMMYHCYLAADRNGLSGSRHSLMYLQWEGCSTMSGEMQLRVAVSRWTMGKRNHKSGSWVVCSHGDLACSHMGQMYNCPDYTGCDPEGVYTKSDKLFDLDHGQKYKLLEVLRAVAGGV